MSEMINMCGLWATKDKNGNPMMSGKLTYSSKIFIFKNTNKKKENDPDFYLKIANVEKEKEEVEKKQEELPF